MTTKNVLRAYLEANRRVLAAQTEEGQQLSVTILNTFLGVALWGQEADRRGEPKTLEFLAGKLGITPTTLSTHLRYLGTHYREGREGLGLVTLEIYLMNRRQRVFSLTPKGEALATQLIFILGGSDADTSP